MSVLAITGGTGFLGGHVVRLALEAGHEVRALTRRPRPARAGVTWISGALDDEGALRELATGADAIVHVAGVVNAPDRAGFAAGNIAGTQAMLAAARAVGVPHFVHVSSLSAREPALSAYGWSKAEGDALVQQLAGNWAIVRPPAIYGPGDHEWLELFRLARRGIALLPPGGSLSAIEASDLARLLLALAVDRRSGLILEPDDGRPGGWTHQEFAHAIGAAVGRKVHPIALPRALMMLGSRIDRWVRGPRAKLTADRVAYFCHPDWVCSPSARPPSDLWRPVVPTPEGLAATAAWYRAQGLL